MTLREQILQRIDETPHRPPTMRDIVQRQYPLTCLVIDAALKAMLASGEIDTEQGDSGLTYIRRKIHSEQAPSPHAPEQMKERQANGLAYFPSRNGQPQAITPTERKTLRVCTVPRPMTKHELAEAERERKFDLRQKMKADADRIKKKRAERKDSLKNRRLIAKHLTKPMIAKNFAVSANIPLQTAHSILNRAFARKTVLRSIDKRPRLFWVSAEHNGRIAT